MLSFGGIPDFSFLQVTKPDLRGVLQMLAAHRMYATGIKAKRKSVAVAIGFFDKQATTGGLRRS